jgi:O-antigen/teichoic acid export membrane protein
VITSAQPSTETCETSAASSAQELKQKTARATLVSGAAQIATFTLRTASMVAMARLLTPQEFGLVGMVTAVTGALGLFKEAGLATASVQQASLRPDQSSTLFWINLAIGVFLAAVTAMLAPFLVKLYGDPRLLMVGIAMGAGFIASGATAQHRALLLRQMRFTALSIVEIVSLVLSIATAMGVALAGGGYWALVAMNVGPAVFSVLGFFFATRWVPGRPRRGTGIKAMLHYGGTLTINSLVVYVAYNAEKVLLGRFWGAEALGLYGRAYQLVNLPTENLNSTIGSVAFPALCRVQNDPERLRSFFLRGYSLFLSLVIPITMGCALFAEDIILVFLGSKWNAAIPIFRLLVPTILSFALINPFAWLMMAMGMATRSLKIALMIAPTVILGYLFGLKHGPEGIAVGYSVALVLIIVPMILWAKHGTLISNRDVLKAISQPGLSALAAGTVVWFCRGFLSGVEPALLRLTISTAILFGIYALLLLFVMKQQPVYARLLRETGLLRRAV